MAVEGEGPRPGGAADGDQLDRDLAIEPGIVGREHDAHPPGTERTEHREPADRHGAGRGAEQPLVHARLHEVHLDVHRCFHRHGEESCHWDGFRRGR